MEIWYFQSGPGVPEQPDCGVYPFDLCRYGSDCQTDGINWRKFINSLSQQLKLIYAFYNLQIKDAPVEIQNGIVL